MKEEIVNFEIAKLAKEKGIYLGRKDEYDGRYYDENGNIKAFETEFARRISREISSKQDKFIRESLRAKDWCWESREDLDGYILRYGKVEVDNDVYSFYMRNELICRWKQEMAMHQDGNSYSIIITGTVL